MKLVIVGNGNKVLTIKGLKELGYKVWSDATCTEKGADRTFVYDSHLETVVQMLLTAHREGYENVVIFGVPKDNYICFTVGYLSAQGMNIKWEGINDNWGIIREIQKTR